MQLKWEYVVTEEEKLPEFGEKGWELVTVLQHKGRTKCYLKKPKKTFTERITDEQQAAVSSQLAERKDGGSR